jgi:hypothetical protein
MKLSYLAVAVAAAISLAGCDDSPSPEEEQAYVDQQAQMAVRAQLATDEKELKTAVEDMKRSDPSIKDAYYGVDSNNQKELHVVHQSAEGTSGFSEMVWPMVGGMAVGAIAANMMSSGGGLKGYAASHPPRSYASYDEEERKRRRNVGSSGYTGMLMSSSRGNIYRSPNFQSSMRESVITTRSTGGFRGVTSARGGGYSFGG